MDVSDMTDAQVVYAFEAWDEYEALEEELDMSNRARYLAPYFCYGFQHYSPKGFDWSEVTAEQILEVGSPMPWRPADLDMVRENGVEVEELLAAIDELRTLRIVAARWVRRILAECASTYNPMEAGSSGGDVLDFLDRASYKTPELMRKRLESPWLFGEICLEFERVLLNMQGR